MRTRLTMIHSYFQEQMEMRFLGEVFNVTIFNTPATPLSLLLFQHSV